MITVRTELRCMTRGCVEMVKSGSSKVAMPEWVEMIASEKGWLPVDFHGLKRYLCPWCQTKNKGAKDE